MEFVSSALRVPETADNGIDSDGLKMLRRYIDAIPRGQDAETP